ncbi:uncharacterized protein N7511_006647 [Penicillium nucicola]|uniref:uncharacterized protein n=1 Tax=Penicillium nucicola TaxID=1850975 RepID=UPI00254542D4|nr:uncharacterized protein N7511_006647 [Penicillium nucicola]KAJ5757953.1 hypothetical protein N7511_006647 [Penicillium nucicola]
MRNLFKAMATFMKKFKRKRRLSTELHSRWGDVSISYPTQGSWNQWNQPAGFVTNASKASPNLRRDDDEQRYTPTGSIRQQSPSSLGRRSRSAGPRENPVGSQLPFPTGHFDENIRRRAGDRENRPLPNQGLGIGDLRNGPGGHLPARRASSSRSDESTVDDSCDEDEERDTLGVPRARLSPRDLRDYDSDMSAPRDTIDYDIAAKSPPLSVTSRMRRCSFQSCATDPMTSASGAPSSRRTSYTAASSISAPSMPPSTPRVASNVANYTPFPEKRHAPRVKQEPETALRQEMVPSYDELYG